MEDTSYRHPSDLTAAQTIRLEVARELMRTPLNALVHDYTSEFNAAILAIAKAIETGE